MPGAPNAEAIAWYVKRSEDLLDDLRDRVRLLRTRGGQLAGFSGAVLALAGANIASVLDALHGVLRGCAGISLLVGVLMLVASLVTALRGTPAARYVADLSAEEVANYTADRFIREPDLWRVHVRTIRSLLREIEVITLESDQAAQAVRKAEYLFLTGLTSVGIVLGVLIAEVTL
ncbi:MAG: hypothetical protein ACRDPE_20730 [Solirubrobacterales bacterium]